MDNLKILAPEDYLMHFGIQGQKWGIRRFQNEDGSLTAAGRRRYGKEFSKDIKRGRDQHRQDVIDVENKVLADKEYKKLKEQSDNSMSKLQKHINDFQNPNTRVKATADYLKEKQNITPKNNLEEWNRDMWRRLNDDGDNGEVFEHFLSKRGINKSLLDKKIYALDLEYPKIASKYITEDIKNTTVKNKYGHKITGEQAITDALYKRNKLFDTDKYYTNEYATLPPDWGWDFEVDENWNDKGPGKLKKLR